MPEVGCLLNARGRLSLVLYLYLPQVLVDGCHVLVWMPRELHACWEGVMQEERNILLKCGYVMVNYVRNIMSLKYCI